MRHSKGWMISSFKHLLCLKFLLSLLYNRLFCVQEKNLRIKITPRGRLGKIRILFLTLRDLFTNKSVSCWLKTTQIVNTRIIQMNYFQDGIRVLFSAGEPPSNRILRWNPQVAGFHRFWNGLSDFCQYRNIFRNKKVTGFEIYSS